MTKLKLYFQNQLPDIDKVLRGLAGRILGGADKARAQAFSRDGGGAPEDGGDDGDGGGLVLPPIRYLVLLASSGTLLLWALFGFFTVDASEEAVMFRLGNPSGVKSPGLAWHMPLIEDYRIVNLTDVRRVEVGFRNDPSNPRNKQSRESLMLTGDLNIIDMQFVVQYALNDTELFLFENRFTNARAEDVVKQVAETAMRGVVGKSRIDFALYEGRVSIASDTKQAMQSILDRYKTGIEVREVAIQNVQPPDQVQEAFEDAIRARQDKERKINEGQAYANDILPRAQGQVARLLEDAEAYRQSVVAGAAGDVARFLLIADEFAKAPEVTRRRLYLETLEEVMGRASKVIIDQQDSGNLLYLPLDRLLQAGGAAAASRGGGGDSPAFPAASPSAPATLDELKNRLRRGVRDGLDSLEARR
ncbi:MAG: FtsH protease activity modulator HflK [Gammaproteobacteria bacterium]